MPLTESVLHFFSDHSRFLKRGESILVACSGGPDSVALVNVLHQISDRLPYKFHVAHINHGLRGRESDQDAEFVKKISQEKGFSFHLKPIRIQPRTGGNSEEEARVKRYEALVNLASRLKSSLVLTAHTLDDQAETILMNLARGTGPEGLSGMKPLRRLKGSIFVGRPFLGVLKKDILGFLREVKASYRTDRSNKNQKFMRNWLRGSLIPLWDKKSPGIRGRVAQLGRIMADEQVYWEGLMEKASKNLVKQHRGGNLVDFKRLLRYPPAFQRRLLRRIPGPDLLTFEGSERFRRWMASPPSNGRFFQLKKGWQAERLSKSKGAPTAHLFWITKNSGKYN